MCLISFCQTHLSKSLPIRHDLVSSSKCSIGKQHARIHFKPSTNLDMPGQGLRVYYEGS